MSHVYTPRGVDTIPRFVFHERTFCPAFVTTRETTPTFVSRSSCRPSVGWTPLVQLVLISLHLPLALLRNPSSYGGAPSLVLNRRSSSNTCPCCDTFIAWQHTVQWLSSGSAASSLNPAWFLAMTSLRRSQACPCRTLSQSSAARGWSVLRCGGWVMVNASEAISFRLRCRLLRQVSGDIAHWDINIT